MPRFDYLPQTFDGQSLTAAPFSSVIFRTQTGPTSTARPMTPVAAEVIGLGSQDVRSQPQAVTWELHCQLVDAEEATLLAFAKVFSEERGLAFLVANDGAGAAWRVLCRVVGTFERWPLRWSVHLWVPTPLWEQNALQSQTQLAMSGNSVTLSPSPNNAGSRRSRPTLTLTPRALKTETATDYRESLRGFCVNVSERFWRGPLCLTDAEGLDDPIDHAALVTLGRSQADGDDIRAWIDGVEVTRTLGGANMASLRIWANEVTMAPGKAIKVIGSVTATSPATGGDLPVEEDISDLLETGWVAIENEVIAYRSRDLTNKKLVNIQRGAWGTLAVNHGASPTAQRGSPSGFLYVISNRKSAAIAPVADLNRRPAFQIAGGASGSRNGQWLYGDEAADADTVFHDSDNPNRPASFQPSLVLADDHAAKSVRLETSKAAALWRADAPFIDKRDVPRLLLNTSSSVIAVKGSHTFLQAMRLLMLGTDADGNEWDVSDLWQKTEETVTKSVPVAKPVFRLGLSAVWAAVTGNKNKGTAVANITTTGEFLDQKFVLDQNTVLDQVGIWVERSAGATAGQTLKAELRRDATGTPGDPVSQAETVAILDVPTVTGGSLLMLFATQQLRLQAGTYWLRFGSLSAGFTPGIKIYGGVQTNRNDILRNQAGVIANLVMYLTVIHKSSGPVQKETEMLSDPGRDAGFDKMSILMAGGNEYKDLILNDNPVLYWRMGEVAGNYIDLAGVSNDGTPEGGLTRGIVGAIKDDDGAVTFNGTTGAITSPDQDELDVGDKLSIEMWVKRATFGTVQAIIAKDRVATSGMRINFNTSNKISVQNFNNVLFTSSAAIADTNWHHIVITRDGSDRHIYIDGIEGTVLVNTISFGTNTEVLEVGKENTGTTPASGFYNGSMDELVMYAYALSATQVKAHFDMGSAGKLATRGVPYVHRVSYPDVVLADAPNLYWRLGETSGQFRDRGGTVNNLGTANGMIRGVAGAIPGDGNLAVRSTVGTMYVSTPSHVELDVGDTFTLEAWVKRSSLLAAASIFSKGANGYQLRFNAVTNFLELWKENVASMVASTIALDTNWHHVVATKAGAVVNLYIDGVDRTGTVTNQTIVNTTNELRLGMRVTNSDEPFRGDLDEAAIYPTALSAARVKAHFDAGAGVFRDDLYHAIGKIKNSTTAQELGLDLWLAKDASLVIDTEAMTAEYQEGNLRIPVPASLTPDDLARWLELAPGANTLIYEDVSMVNTDLTVAFRGRKV